MPLATSSELPIEIDRETPPSRLLPFTDYFQGFERVDAVRSVFGNSTEAVLRDLKVSFLSLRFAYMGISDEDGSISVGTYHLRHGDFRTLYLDVVHELFHIRQWQEDRAYFGKEHRKFLGDWSLYYASPIEVPAYKHTVREAERIGMTRDEIVEHLRMGPVPPKAFARFLDVMEIRRGPKPRRIIRPPVRINRNASVALFPFTDYFSGFEKVPAVRKLFGERTARVLKQLKVEFVNSSFVRMIPSDEHGHLIVSLPHLKSSDPTSAYLDVFASLSMLASTPRHRGTSGDPRVNFQDEPALFDSYKAMLEEARRLNVPDAKVLDHLRIPQFLLDAASYKKFVRKLGLHPV
jgi:hypothetical protein